MTRSSSYIIGQLRAAEQYTINLPVLGGVPTKIDCSNEMLGSVFMDAKVDFYWVVSENATQAAVLLANAAKIKKGSSTPNSVYVGSITKAQLEEIATIKLPDLNTTKLVRVALVYLDF